MAARQPIKLSGLISKGAIAPLATPPSSESAEAPPPIKSDSALPAQRAHAPFLSPVNATENHSNNDANLRSVGTHKFYEQLIDVSLIDANPFAPREIYTSQMLLTRAEELRTQGQHDPIHVIPHPVDAGRFMIADGWTRVQACQLHQALPSLRAQVYLDMTPLQAGWFGYESNEGREAASDYDRGMFYAKLLAEGESQTSVAERVGISKTALTMFLSFHRLPDEVHAIITENPKKFSYKATYEISRIYEKAGVRKALAVAIKFAAEDLPLKWLLNQTQAVLHPTKSTQPATQKYLRYANGVYKQRGDTFEVSMQVAPEKRDLFASELEKLLSTVAIDAPPAAEFADNKQGKEPQANEENNP